MYRIEILKNKKIIIVKVMPNIKEQFVKKVQ